MGCCDAYFRITRPFDQAEAPIHLESPRYKGQLVFVSHCLKAGEREVVDCLLALLKSRRVPVFEYFAGNEAGEEWKQKMTAALQRTTLFVALLTDQYEQSEPCDEEWKSMDRSKVEILPFLLNGRHNPHITLKNAHHKSLSSQDPEENAREVARRIIEVLSDRSNPAVLAR